VATIAFNSRAATRPPAINELGNTSLRELIVRFQSGEISALDTLIRRTEERHSF
jgi:hypothetical protein